MTAVLGLLTFALGAPSVVTLEGSVREEVRGGTAVGTTSGPNTIGFNEVLTPGLAGSWTDQENRVYALYDPELQIPDLGVGNHLEVLHRARLEYDWKERSGSPTITVAQDFQYGIIDLFALTPPLGGAPKGSALPPPPIVLQPIPTVSRFPYESSNSTLAFRLVPSQRVTLDLSTGYSLSGGTTPAAQLSLPLQQGPFANAALRYEPTKHEVLTTRVSLTDQLFSNTVGPTGTGATGPGPAPGPRDVLLEAVEQLSSQLDRHLVGTLGGGVAGLRSQVPALPPVTQVFPEAQAILTDIWPLDGHSSLEGGVSAILAPLIDRLGGSTFESLQMLGRLNWNLFSDLSLLALGGLTVPVYGNVAVAQRLELLQGALGYQPAKFVLLQAGAVFTAQQGQTGLQAGSPAPLPPPAGSSSSQWMAFIGFTLRDSMTSSE